ncbi:TolC family protein [Algoriphagus sp. NF]|jgi:outer membrane protein TolC|uniref:TolC family protein n=1 Tax=Algoriphagus sp. NF TaxID=2992756 RepID=UPI00237A2519|nr:TolC family protein [Algoriphagus sp. NF]MDE0560461.1 TolC family protein [Algoriphagus sp. NF]
MKKILIGLILGLMTQPLLAQDQEPLDLEKAIQQGLENNFQVKIAVETISLRQGEIGLGWSAFFPVVDAIYTRSYANEDVVQTFRNDPETPIEILGARTQSENFTMAAIYGFRPEAVVAIKRLGQLAEISELDAKVAVENTVAAISTAYYRLVLELQRYEVLERTLELSQARLDIAQAQYELGGAGKRDFLTAEVDYNTDLSLLKSQSQVIEAARINLNELMALEPGVKFFVNDTITVGDELRLLDLEENALLQNKQWLITQRQENVAFLQLRELQVARLPAINLNASYADNTFNSVAGFLIQNQRSGFNYGGNISFNLFSGFALNRRIQNAKVQQRIQNYTVDQFEIQLKSDLYRAFNTYMNNRELLEIEQRNYAVAKESSEIALERFRLGIASYLEFRDAQVNLLTAENRLITSIYNIKEQEIELMRLSGKIYFENSSDQLPLN